MLLIAGLMGAMAAGAIAYVEITAEPQDDAEGDDNAEAQEKLAEEFSDTPVIDLISGTEMPDTLLGDDGMDRIAGGAGDDVIDAGAGDDEARGGIGDDFLEGGDGDDRLHGEAGDDSLFGGDAEDAIFGHGDNDTLWGGLGADSLQGAAGDDSLFGGEGDDALQGGLDNDTLYGGDGVDTLMGGWGDDVINGLEPSNADALQWQYTAAATLLDTDDGDFLNGGGGEDILVAGNDDVVTSGEGADDIVLGDWIAEDRQAQILDYAPEEDSLLFVWDDSDGTGEEPEVRIEPDPENDGQMQVWMGDSVVAQVAGDAPITDANIALVPLSAMQGLNLTAA